MGAVVYIPGMGGVNATYRANMVSLNKYMVTMALRVFFEKMEKHIASTKVVPQTVEDDNVNNIPPLNNKTENSKGNNNKHHSKKKCQIAIKYFQDKNLSPAEVTKALEDEKFTAIEIQTVMKGISFKKA